VNGHKEPFTGFNKLPLHHPPNLNPDVSGERNEFASSPPASIMLFSHIARCQKERGSGLWPEHHLGEGSGDA